MAPVLPKALAWCRRYVLTFGLVSLGLLGLALILPSTNTAETQKRSWSRTNLRGTPANSQWSATDGLPVAFATHALGEWTQLPDPPSATTFCYADGALNISSSDDVTNCTEANRVNISSCLTWQSRAAREGASEPGTTLPIHGVTALYSRVQTRSKNPQHLRMLTRVPIMSSSSIDASVTTYYFHALTPDAPRTSQQSDDSAQQPLTWFAVGSMHKTAASERNSLQIFAEEGEDDPSSGVTPLLPPDQAGTLRALIADYQSSASFGVRETLQLFALLYAHQDQLLARTRKSASTSTETPRAAALPPMLSEACRWLGEFTLRTGPNVPVALHGKAATHVTARLWSTCGDFITLEADDAQYARLTCRLNLFISGVIVVAGAVMVVAATRQGWSLSNSRGRALRVSAVEMGLLMIWCWAVAATLPFLMNVAPELDRSVALSWLLWAAVGGLLTSLCTRVVHQQRLPEARIGCLGSWLLTLFLILLACCAMVVSWSVDLRRYMFNGVFLLTFTVIVWLPQWCVSFQQNGWSGLHVQFICGAGACLCAPLVGLAWCVPTPFTVPRWLQWKLSLVIVAVAAQTALLAIFAASNGHYILPSWFARWRHRYATTAEAQRALLSENNECPICRGPLDELTEDGDELWITPCHHLFHKLCLHQWLTERMECPLCRTVLPDP